MDKTVRKIWNLLSLLIVTTAVIFALLLVGGRLIGLRVYSVLSGSMEPVYHVGSLIYVKPVDVFQLKSGDVISFVLGENTVATHRIVEVVPDENDSNVLRFRTKGDANSAEDGSLVHHKNIIGTPVFSIPKLGHVADFIQNPPGMYISLALAAVLVIFVALPDFLYTSKFKARGSH